MEELVRLVATLRDRANEHGPALRANEALTRHALIDPLLRRLGWDTEDPSQVVPEYVIPSSKGKRADYALFTGHASVNGRVPEAVVEAKSLGTPLFDAAQQAVNYCTVAGFEYFVVTDGDDWQLFETRRKGNLDAKRITRFHLLSDAIADVCRKALAMWRQGFEEGAVDAVPVRKANAAETSDSGQGVAPPAVERTKAEGLPAGDGWVLLSSLAPDAKGATPAELRVPSGNLVPIATWKDLMQEVVGWLVANGDLSAASDPLQVGKRYVLARQPKHPNGTDFTAPREAGGLFVETHHGAESAVRQTCAIVNHGGADLAGFSVRLNP